MPGKRITELQVGMYMSARKEGFTQVVSAAKADISERSGRRIDDQELTTALSTRRHWRTRKDPLGEIWRSSLVPLLETNPSLTSTTLFDWLDDNYPGQYDGSIMRTLQRRVKAWKIEKGPDKEVRLRRKQLYCREKLQDGFRLTQLKRRAVLQATKSLSCFFI